MAFGTTATTSLTLSTYSTSQKHQGNMNRPSKSIRHSCYLLYLMVIMQNHHRPKLRALLFFKISFMFRQRGREGEGKGEKHQCVVASCAHPTGDIACNPGMCLDWKSNHQPFGSQASTQSTEPHQPGLGAAIFPPSYKAFQNVSIKFSIFCNS